MIGRVLAGLLLALSLVGCATYREDLNRGQRFYEENEYTRALAIFRVLETDMDSLELQDQARYAYLRGMTGYRLGFRPDARHWLALAKAIEQEHPGGLQPQWKQRLDESLTDLNKDVYGGADSMGSDAGATAAENPAALPPAGCGAGCPSGQTCQSNECVPL